MTLKYKDNFNQLLVVEITEDFEFEARMLVEKCMGKGQGKHAVVAWSSMKPKRPAKNATCTISPDRSLCLLGDDF